MWKFHKKTEDMRKLVMLSDSSNIVAEQFRKLRTNLQLASLTKPVQTIAITSATPHEGKTMCAANLAIAFAQHNQRVLLIDLDLHQPTLHRLFRVSDSVGLSDVLLQGIEPAVAIQELPIYQLYLLASGPTLLLQQERISSEKLAALFEELKQQFDTILIDTSPILSLSTTALIANQSDGVLIVGQQGKVTKQQLTEANTMLIRAQANVLGVVVNHYELTKQQLNYYKMTKS